MRDQTIQHPPKAHRRGGLVACAIAVALLSAACGGSKASSAGSGQSTPTSAAQAATTVAIDTFMFAPKLTRIHVGDTITWTNKDSILHTVTSGTREYDPNNSGLVTATHKDGVFDMKLDGRGQTGRFTFTTAGTFHYFCNQHPGMEADVEVS